MRRSRIRQTFAGAVLFLASMPGAAILYAEVNFNLPCLAPLLERIDEDAPLSIDEAFIFGPWHSPLVRDDIGKVEFPIATDSEDAQKLFNQGIALLHGFSYHEAERCFRAALALDEDCPMIFWGLAMANERQPARAALFASNAIRYSVNRGELSKLERKWLALLGDFYKGVVPGTGIKAIELTPEEWEDRRIAWVRGLEDMAFEFPDNVEVSAFLLRRVILDHYRSGTPIASYFANHLLADKIAEMAPAHPSRHYRLLLWMKQNPGRAIDYVGGPPEVAPGLADSWRFSGQLLVAAGRPRQAVPYLEASITVAQRELARPSVMPDKVENLVANYEALVDVLTGLGRFEEVRLVARDLVRLPRTFYLEKRDTQEDFAAGSFAAGRRLLGQIHLRLELWRELLEECEEGELRPVGDAFSENDSSFWRGLALANMGKIEEAKGLVGEMSDGISSSLGKGVPPIIIDMMKRQARTLRSQIDYLDGSRSGPPERKTDLTWLPRGYLSRVYFGNGMKEDALEMAGEEYANRPGQVLAIANFIDLQFRSDNLKQALYVFDSGFRINASEARRGLPVLNRIQPVAEKMQLGKVWTSKAKSIESVDVFPEDGVAKWIPVASRDWTLKDHTGADVTLQELEGKPVLLNFFLGVSCAFCRVQLDKFRPHVSGFEEEGIRFVAVSQDSVEVLQKAMGSEPEKSEEGRTLFPFTVLADPDFEEFRYYGAYDDFGTRAMHGTVLLDEKGRILWSHVGHGPFSFPQSLLDEAVRLLGDGQ